MMMMMMIIKKLLNGILDMHADNVTTLNLTLWQRKHFLHALKL